MERDLRNAPAARTGASPPSEAWLFAQAVLGKPVPSASRQEADARARREHLEWLAQISPEDARRVRGQLSEEADAKAQRELLEWLAEISPEHEVKLRALQRAEAESRETREHWEWLAEVSSVREAEWDSSLHPRVPKGQPDGGQWVANGGGGGLLAAQNLGQANWSEVWTSIWNPLDARQASQAANEAQQLAAKLAHEMGHEGTDWNGPQDAMRHAIWNALMAQRIGADEAKKFADAHEASSDSPEETAMDKWNNAVGRALGAANPKSDVVELVRGAYVKGQLRILRRTRNERVMPGMPLRPTGDGPGIAAPLDPGVPYNSGPGNPYPKRVAKPANSETNPFKFGGKILEADSCNREPKSVRQ